jgi:hypothetical protein
MNNYRMWAYALIATGLINWDYQRAQPNVIAHSLLIVVPGAILLAITFSKSLSSYLKIPAAKYICGLIGIAALAYALIN